MCDLDVVTSTNAKNQLQKPMIENGSSLQLEIQWLRDKSADAYGAYLHISV